MPHRIRIAITPGEPAGIGPELCVGLAQRSTDMDCVLVCDPELLRQRAAVTGMPARIREFDPDAAIVRRAPGEMLVLATEMATPSEPGRVDPRNAPYVLRTIELAVRGCLQGTFDALVTGPVHKGVINAAGIPFSGHTEYLAEQTGTAVPVMLLAAPSLRVALLTTHLPLAAVNQWVTRDRILNVVRVLHRELPRQLGIVDPRIAVCGLNPHAGDDGALGMEEKECIAPAIDTLRRDGIDVTGPLPADTVFTPRYLQQTDVVLAMYHDQGLPVLKYSGFGRAVNITLGLPIIRTSVDHGTALDIAGSGTADTGSLFAALETAVTIAERIAAA